MYSAHAHARALDSNRLVPSQIISGHERRTTLMMKNVPIRLQIHELAHLVDQTIHDSEYDVIRLPQDDRIPQCNKGYAFVNCTSSEAVLKFWARWHCRSWRDLFQNCQKICQISFAQHQLPVNGCGMIDFTVKASQSVLRRSVQLQKPAASLHEPCIASTKIYQHTGKLSSAWALDLRKAQNQDDQHRLEGPYDEPVESVNTFRTGSNGGEQKPSRRERRIWHLQALQQQQAEGECGDLGGLHENCDANCMGCVNADGKKKTRSRGRRRQNSNTLDRQAKAVKAITIVEVVSCKGNGENAGAERLLAQ